MKATTDDVLRKVVSSDPLSAILKDDSVKAANRPSFVQPSFLVKRDHAKPRVIIISAPGAVGKSTFAKYTSFVKHSFLWDLSTIRLGDNTFVGTIAKYFGNNKLSSVLESFQAGRVGFLFDAFDEAEIVSGLDGIEKFVREVADVIASGDQCNVVFFSRTETTAFLEILLDECLGGEYATYEIDYFDEESSYEFVRQQIAEFGDDTFRSYPVPFLEAIKAVFQTIAFGIEEVEGSIWSSDSIRSFIGYSPVLQTVAKYFHENRDYQAILNSFGAGQSAVRGMEVISQFIRDLLSREQGKLVSALRQKVTNAPRAFDEWDSIYNEKAQLQMILKYINNRGVMTGVVDTSLLPQWLIPDFIEVVSQFLPQHPFVRDRDFISPAFKDYTLAAMLISQEAACSQLLRRDAYTLSPLFAYFYKEMHGGNAMGRHVGYLYDSASARLGIEDKELYTYVRAGEGSGYRLEISAADGKTDYSLEMDCILDDSNPLVFVKRLHNATIVIDRDVQIGVSTPTFELSKSSILAKKVSFECGELVVLTKDDEDSAIGGKLFEVKDHAMRIRVTGPKSGFTVCAPEANVYPWVDYYSEMDFEVAEPEHMDLYQLRRILTPFRKHGKNQFGKHREKIDLGIVKNEPTGLKWLRFLKANNIMFESLSDNMYVIDQDVLSEWGVNWGDLKGFRMTEGIRRLVEQFRAFA